MRLLRSRTGKKDSLTTERKGRRGRGEAVSRCGCHATLDKGLLLGDSTDRVCHLVGKRKKSLACPTTKCNIESMLDDLSDSSQILDL